MKPWIISLAAVASLAGCQPKQSTPGPAGGSKKLLLGVVTDRGGINDQSFNASAWRGAQNAQKDLGVEARYAQSQMESDYARNLRSYAKQGYDLIVAVGYLEQDAYNQVAAEYKDTKTKFVIIDGQAANTPNAAGITFKEQEGSFLVGALAAGMSKTGTIGFIGGMHGPVIGRFESGYVAGAKMMRPDIKIISQYTESWDDSSKGQIQAQQQFSTGADIIFHAAGKCGLGVINAAKLQGPGRYAIGVDSDQDHLAPGKVLTSMVKNVDKAVYDFTQKVKSNQFTPGDHQYGLKENGVGLSEMKYTRKDVPADVMAKVDAFKQKIIAGDIVPPATPAELTAFAAKNNFKL
ncbi:MAG TPA: BMP family ABC transporter substrate-binding protein [Armatimonadota bacterium]